MNLEDWCVEYDEVDVFVVKALVCGAVVFLEVLYEPVVDYVGRDCWVVLVSDVVVSWYVVVWGFQGVHYLFGYNGGWFMCWEVGYGVNYVS